MLCDNLQENLFFHFFYLYGKYYTLIYLELGGIKRHLVNDDRVGRSVNTGGNRYLEMDLTTCMKCGRREWPQGAKRKYHWVAALF